MFRALFASLLFTVTLAAQDAVHVAQWVREPNVDAARLAAAIASKDALTRATAARVALVRNVDAALPALRAAAVTERDGVAAREQIRALTLLGTVDDVALASKQLARFPGSIDSDFTEAIARRGAPEAVSLYLQYRGALRDPSPYVMLALWGRASQSSATASRFIGAEDARAFRSLTSGMLSADIDLDPNVLAAALESRNDAVRTQALWYSISRFAVETDKVPESAAAPREGSTAEESFAREVLRRMRGGEPKESDEWVAWLKSDEGRWRVPFGKAVRRHLTLAEQKALKWEPPKDEPAGLPIPRQQVEFEQPPFSLPMRLPEGLDDALLRENKCDGEWLGVVSAAVDQSGRVQSIEVSKVSTNQSGCKSALETMLRMTLAHPKKLNAALTTNSLLAVKAEGKTACFDESPLAAAGGEVRHVGGAMKPPKILRRIEPPFPESVRSVMTERSALVIVESTISTSGCIRDLALLKPAAYPALNGSALLTLAKWKFAPGTLDGQPVDVLFNLTINFKLSH
ncbi:MAG: energy transducer TonB [Acidobacteriota bacterium]|nr:energy transducer TonB [Acidobacteriota bacterium]